MQEPLTETLHIPVHNAAKDRALVRAARMVCHSSVSDLYSKQG